MTIYKCIIMRKARAETQVAKIYFILCSLKNVKLLLRMAH